MLKTIKQKIITLSIKISNYFKFTYIPFLPLHLDIEPINVCNFKCKHCKVTYWNKSKEILDLIKFKKILKQFPNLKSIKLQGLGEPLLNRDLHKLIIECAQKNIHVEFFSNASIYDEHVWNTINKIENIDIIFSVDAANKENFERIRIGSDFEQIISNIKKIIKGYEKKYSFWTVVSKENLSELPQIIKLAGNLGIPKVTFQTFLSDWKSNDVSEYNKNIKYDNLRTLFIENREEAEKIAESFGIILEIYRGNFFSKNKKCSWPFTSAFIASNGDVVPCCVISDSDVIKMGNVFETNFSKIWNSKKYREFRKSIKYHQLNDFCKSCYGEDNEF